MLTLILTLILTPLTASGPTPPSQGSPHVDVTFCNFPLSSGLKQANASFYVSYSFTIDETGKPTGITKIRNDYVEPKEISTCLEKWEFRGVQQGATIVAIFQWKHAQGWVDLSITGGGLNQKIRVAGDRCPY